MFSLHEIIYTSVTYLTKKNLRIFHIPTNIYFMSKTQGYTVSVHRSNYQMKKNDKQ